MKPEDRLHPKSIIISNAYFSHDHKNLDVDYLVNSSVYLDVLSSPSLETIFVNDELEVPLERRVS